MIITNIGKNESFDISHIMALDRATFQDFIPPNKFIFEFGSKRYEITNVEKIVGFSGTWGKKVNTVLTNETTSDITVGISATKDVTLAPGESTTISEEQLAYVEKTTPEVLQILTSTIEETLLDAEAIVADLTNFYGQGGPIYVPSTYDDINGVASVTFTESFKALPQLFMLMGPSGGDAANVRFKDITINDFKAFIVEPESFDGPHAANTLPYAAIQSGIHQIGNITIEVGFIDTKKVQGNSAPVGNEIGWERVTLQNSFPNLGVIASIQTMNNEINPVPSTISTPWVTPTVKPVSDNQFDITLDMSTTKLGTVVVPERIAYIAFSCGQTTTFTDSTGKTIKAETKKVSGITGYTNGGKAITYSQTYAAAPITLATINSRYASKGGWLRYDNNTTTGITLKIDHDTTGVNDRTHTGEDVAVLVLSEAYNLKIQ